MADQVQRLVSELVVVDSASGPTDLVTAAYNRYVEAVGRGVPVEDAAAASTQELADAMSMMGVAAAKYGLSAQGLIAIAESQGIITAKQIEQLNELAAKVQEVKVQEEILANSTAQADQGFTSFEAKARLLAGEFGDDTATVEQLTAGLLAFTAEEDAAAQNAVRLTIASEEEVAAFDAVLAALIRVTTAEAGMAAALAPDEAALTALGQAAMQGATAGGIAFTDFEVRARLLAGELGDLNSPLINLRNNILGFTAEEDMAAAAVVHNTVATNAEIAAFDAKLAAIIAVDEAEAQMLSLMTTQEAVAAGLITQEAQVVSGLDAWRASEEELAAAQAAAQATADGAVVAESKIAAVKGEVVNADIVLTDAEAARFAAMGITTEMLGVETAATLAAAKATDEQTSAYLRLRAGAVSMGEALGPLQLGILAVGAAFVFAALQATHWETELNQLQNNTSITDADVQQMGTNIIDTAKKTGAGFDDLAQGSRHILDYSFSANDALKILNVTSEAAVSTGAKAETVAQGVAQALHQYGASANEAANYTNILLRSSQLANTTLQQFSDQTKTAVGFSAAIGNSYADTTAALSALTRVYGDASKASAGLDDILRYMLKPTAEEAGAWDDLAKKSGNAALSSENLARTLGSQGLNGVINQVAAAYQKMGLSSEAAGQETLNLLNGQRGGIALYALLNSGLGDYNSALAENNRIIGGQLDPTSKAFNNTLDTAQNKWDRAGAALHQLTAEGTAFSAAWGGLADLVAGMTNSVGTLLSPLTSLDNAAKDFGTTMGALGNAISTGDWQHFSDVFGEKNQANMDKYAQGLIVLSADQQKANDTAMASMQAYGALGNVIANTGTVANKTGVDIQGLADQQAQLKDEAKSSTAAYAAATKEGFQTALDNTQKQMSDLVQTIDKAKEFRDQAQKAGNAHETELWNQFIDEQTKVQGSLNDELTILNAFSKSAGDAGYNAGKAWADNYTAQLNAALAQTSRQGVQTYSPGAPTTEGMGGPTASPYLLPGLTKEQEAARVQAIMVEESTPSAAAGRRAAAAGREAATDARQQQTAENALTTAQQKYELDSRQLQLTENLTDAKNAETAAQKVLTDGDKEYNAALQQLTDGQEANNVAKRDDVALNEAIATAANTQASAATVAAEDAKKANDLTVAIHQTTDQLAELDREAQIAMKPLKDTLDADTAAMKELDKATADQDLIYTRQKEGIQELQYQEGLQEKQIMGPYITAYQASAAAVAAAQENVQKISDSYDQRLIPLTDKLTELEKEKANIQRQDVLGNEAQSVANLGAQLKNLVPGSAAYNEVLKQQAEAQKNLGLDVQIDKLTKQKDAIEAQKTKALEAANLQLKAAQEQEKASKIAMDAEQKIFDQQKQNLSDQAALVAHNQTIYDEQQRDKKVAQQATIDADNAAIVSQQKVSDARAASDKAYLTELNNEQGEQSFTAGQHSYVWGLAVTAANQAVKDLEAPYNTEDTRLKNLAQDVRDEKTAFDETKQPIVDNLKDQQAAAQSLLDVFKDAKSNVELASKWADAQAKFAIAMAGVNDSGPPASAAISDLAKAQGLADTNGTAAAKALNDPSTGLIPALAATTTAINTGVAPATANLATTTDTNLGLVGQTWNKYFGLPSSPGYDASVNIAWYMNNHNPDGFYSKLITWADIGLGTQGLRGMFDDRFVEMSTDVVGRATDMGNSIIGGIAAGTSTPAALKALTDAIVGTVQGAIGGAEKAIEAHSPSQLAARRLGLPFGMGIAMGVDQSAAAVTESVRGLFDGAGGTSARYTGGSVGAGVGSVVINMDGMHTHLHFPNVSKPPENANEYTAAAADAISYAVQRRMKQRGLHNEIF